MKFNYSVDREMAGTEPEYDKPYGSYLPPVQAQGNLTYLQFIDVVCALWSAGNPEIKFGPYGAHRIFDPEYGYIIYSLEDKKPKANNPRPRLFEVVDDVNDPAKKVAVFIENFNIIVSFSAVHKDPRIAEELVEAYEDFMIEHTPIFKKLGLENVSYVRRMQDSLEKRFGDDVSSRSIAYMIGVQKILTLPMNKMEEVFIYAQAILSGAATPTYGILEPDATPYYPATPSHIYTKLLDNNSLGVLIE